MINYNITDIESAEFLVKMCRKFKEDINVLYQRQIIDGKSMLGVMSLIGHMVGIEILTENKKVKIALQSSLELRKGE